MREHNCSSAFSGKEALRLLEEKDFDLALIDIRLPDISGIELLSKIKKKFPYVGCIIVTGFPSEESAIDSLNLDAEGYLTKPLDPVIFFEKLERARRIREKKLYDERLESLNQVLRSIRNVNQLIVREQDPEKLLNQVCEILVENDVYFSAWILTINQKKKPVNLYQAGVESGFEEFTDRVKNGEYPLCIEKYINEKGVTFIHAREKKCKDCPLAFEIKHRICSITRIEYLKKVYGLLVLSSKKDVDEEEASSLILEIATDIGYALNRLEIQREKEENARHLQERLKELGALYTLSSLIEKHGFDIQKICKEYVELLPMGYQFPDITCAKIIIDDQIYQSSNFKETEWSQSTHIMIEDISSGRIEVHLLEKPSDSNELFLEEEDDIINEVSKQLSSVYLHERIESERDEALKHFRTLFNVVVDPMVILNSDGKIIEVTERVEKAIGYRKDEIIGRKIQELVFLTPEGKNILKSNLGKRLAGKDIPPYIVELITKKGAKKSFEVNAEKIDFYQGTAVMAAFRDITERIKADRALRESERLFRQFFENQPTYCYIVSLDGVIIDVNKAALDTLGYKKEELVGQPVMEIYAPECRPVVNRLLSKWKEVGRLRNEELVVISKKGERRTVLLSADLVRDQDDRVLHSISVQRDITERKNYEERLKTLHRHTTSLSSALTLEEVAHITVSVLNSALGFKQHSFNVVEGDVIKTLLSEPSRANLELPLDGRGIIVRAVKSGKVQLVPDVRKDPDFIPGLGGTDSPTLSELAVPVKVDEDVVAVINVESEILGAFKDQDRYLIEILGEYVSATISRLRQFYEIQRSEVRYRRLLEEMPDPVFISDHEKYLFVNQRAIELLGYDSSTEIIGHDFVDFFSEEYKSIVQSRATERLSGSEIQRQYDLVMLSKEGERIDLEVNLRNIMFMNEPAVLSVMRDIRPRKKHEKRLEALHKHTSILSKAQSIEGIYKITYDLLVETLEFPVIDVIKVEDGLLRDVFSYDNSVESLTLKVTDKGITSRAARTGETQLVKDTRQDNDYVQGNREWKALSELAVPVRLGGHTRVVLNIESPEANAFTDEDKRLVEILGEHVATNISRIEAEKEKTEYANRLNAIHRFGSRLDKALSYEMVAKETMDKIMNILGYETGSFGIVKDDAILFTEFRRPSKIHKLSLEGKGITVRAVRTGETQLVHDTRIDPDYISGRVEGDPETLSELDVPVKVNDEVVALINLEAEKINAFDDHDLRLVETMALHVSSAFARLRRIDDLERLIEQRTMELRQAYDDLQELDRMKDQFISTATHELRTPLVSIKGYVDYIQSGSAGEINERVRELLEIVQRNTWRLEKLTDDLLDQQRIESGRLEIKRTKIMYDVLLSEVLEEIEPMMNEKEQTLGVMAPTKLPEVLADKTRIGQVLLNLLNNAIKFSPKGSNIFLKIEEKEDKIKSSVIDEGIGLSSEDIDKLFKPFPTIDRPTVAGKSTGLGLSICKGIVELHGGRIWAESEGRGKGSTFTYTLPLNSEKDAYSILILDDEADIRNLGRRILEEKGYKVLTAEDSSTGLRMAEEELPDLILLDVVMPGRSGFDTCRELKLKSSTRDIPVIMFSVLSRDVDKKMAEEAGADDYITKPFDTEELLSSIKKALS
ncbi:PAS domain S-box protein [Candidatus Bathyarchaeota archaeon]|nr:PAS domain S-box protein [Candidatus Bathyarchaeota archaeon]